MVPVELRLAPLSGPDVFVPQMTDNGQGLGLARADHEGPLFRWRPPRRRHRLGLQTGLKKRCQAVIALIRQSGGTLGVNETKGSRRVP